MKPNRINMKKLRHECWQRDQLSTCHHNGARRIFIQHRIQNCSLIILVKIHNSFANMDGSPFGMCLRQFCEHERSFCAARAVPIRDNALFDVFDTPCIQIGQFYYRFLTSLGSHQIEFASFTPGPIDIWYDTLLSVHLYQRTNTLRYENHYHPSIMSCQQRWRGKTITG